MEESDLTNIILSRATLDITYKLLRNHEPQLALTIRNILFEPAIENKPEQIDNKHTDNFHINLNTFEVRKIVETLMHILNESSENHSEDNTSLFRPILIQSIINDWTVLAKNMFDEYQKNKESD